MCKIKFREPSLSGSNIFPFVEFWWADSTQLLNSNIQKTVLWAKVKEG